MAGESEVSEKPQALLGKMGDLEVRLARGDEEMRQAQRLRYEVFYEELNAEPSADNKAQRLDVDKYDTHCDHLIVVDTADEKKPIVATYRLLLEKNAQEAGGFYSESEFDIAPMLQAHAGKHFLELGRSCVLEAYRNKRTIELLWQGTWAYILRNKVDVLFGCASLVGTDLAELSAPLSFLQQNCAATDNWRVEPMSHMAAEYELVEKEALDLKRSMRQLPPLIKGYLRLGAKTSSGAVIDHQFNTTDVMIILPVADINPSYVNYYGADASRHAA